MKSVYHGSCAACCCTITPAVHVCFKPTDGRTSDVLLFVIPFRPFLPFLPLLSPPCRRHAIFKPLQTAKAERGEVDIADIRSSDRQTWREGSSWPNDGREPRVSPDATCVQSVGRLVPHVMHNLRSLRAHPSVGPRWIAICKLEIGKHRARCATHSTDSDGKMK